MEGVVAHRFTQQDANDYAERVSCYLGRRDIAVVGRPFDLGSKMGVAVKLPSGKRHAVSVIDPAMPVDVIGIMLELWIEDQERG